MRKNTAVSRLRIAVTSATRASAETRSDLGPRGSREKPSPRGREEPVALGDDADQQEAGDEANAGQRLCCGFAVASAVHVDRGTVGETR